MAFCLYFIGAISFDICNRMLNRFFLIDPELLLRPKMRIRSWVLKFRGCSPCRPHDLILCIGLGGGYRAFMGLLNRQPGLHFFLFFFFLNKFIYLFIFGCVGSSLLCAGFL